MRRLLLAAILTAMASTAHSTTFSFGDIDGLGTVTGSGSVQDFYGYHDAAGDKTYRFNGPVDAQNGTAYMFVYEDGADLSLGMFFTGADVLRKNAVCGPIEHRDLCRSYANMTITGLASDSQVLVRDDQNNGFGDTDARHAGANGAYGFAAFTGGTDGFVASGVLLGADITFDVTRLERITQSYWVSGAGDDLSLTSIDFASGGVLGVNGKTPGDISLSATTAPVPLPAGMALLLSGLGLAGVFARRRRA